MRDKGDKGKDELRDMTEILAALERIWRDIHERKTDITLGVAMHRFSETLSPRGDEVHEGERLLGLLLGTTWKQHANDHYQGDQNEKFAVHGSSFGFFVAVIFLGVLRQSAR